MTEVRRRDRGSGRIPGIARHGRLKRPSPWLAVLKFLAAGLAVVLVSGASVAAVAVWRLQNSIVSVDIGEPEGPPPTIGAYPGGYNLLIAGSDTRVGQGGIGGVDSGNLNDVTMLLHVSEDHTSAVAVSFPRDLVVPIPICSNGGPAAGLPINESLYYGGLPCTVKTVEQLTGLNIQFAGLITFKGVIEMSNAVGGVEVCVAGGDINDIYTGLKLKQGKHTLKGGAALAFLRTRHGVGDGSDLGRISSQQVYLSSLVRKLKSDDTLTNLPKLYSIASAATSNMTLSSNLRSPDTLIAIAQSLRSIPLERIQFVQYPGATGVGGIYSGKVAPIQAQADALFALIKADKPFNVAPSPNNRGSVVDPSKPQPSATTPTSTGKPGTPTTTKPTNSSPTTQKPTSTASPGSDNILTINGYIGQSGDKHTCSVANN